MVPFRRRDRRIKLQDRIEDAADATEADLDAVATRHPPLTSVSSSRSQAGRRTHRLNCHTHSSAGLGVDDDAGDAQPCGSDVLVHDHHLADMPGRGGDDVELRAHDRVTGAAVLCCR
jgi:hypothetical protein